MNIAVIGAARDCEERILQKSFELGQEIAKRKCELFVGGCHGYPHAAAKGAFSAGGTVVAYSPGKDQEEHIVTYHFPIDGFSRIEFTGLGIPRRNYPLVSEAEGVIMIGGQIGSLNEFTLAFHLQKKIGILMGTGGIVDVIPDIAKICDKKGESKNMVYSENGKELIERLLTMH